MALRFDSLIPDAFRLRVHLFPGFESGFSSGYLQSLFGALSGEEETFTHSIIRPAPSAHFDGETWAYTLSENHITVELIGDASLSEFRGTSLRLLRETRRFFAERKAGRSLRFMFPESVLVSGLIPEDQNKDVATIVKNKALGRIKSEHYDLLPGEVRGAALRLVGDDEEYEWNATVAPSLNQPDDLYISADLRFMFPADPPTDDIETVGEVIDKSTDFLTNHVVSFARAVLPEISRRKGQGGNTTDEGGEQ